VKRLGRYSFNAVTAVSLVLAMATAGLWVRSLYKADLLSRWMAWQVDTNDGSCVKSIAQQCGSQGGRVAIELARWHNSGCLIETAEQRGNWRWKHSNGKVDDPADYFSDARRWRLAGVSVSILRDSGALIGGEIRYVALPHWLVVAVFLVLPLWRVATWGFRRAHVRAAGVCETCGYDLRATPDRCPECGTTGRVEG
jgi:hypothetical protein